MTAAHLRKGWCPGALRPMRSGDGLLVRVRPRAGVFSLSALRAIGAAAAEFGSGEIDLTNRGNMQIRGVTDESFDTVLAALDDAGLLDTSAEAEAVRNVVVDPLSGVDPAHSNIRDLAQALEETLALDARLWTLPGKFGFGISGTSSPRVGSRSTDIMASADGGRTLVYLDGGRGACCEVSRHTVIDAVHRLALVFVELRANDTNLRRMRDAVARFGAATIFAMASLKACVLPLDGDTAVPVGLLARRESVFGAGIGLPFGRIMASQLGALCDAAVAANVENVHTSPQRALVVAVSDAESGMALLQRAGDVGLITQAGDVRLAMDVCPGSPACKNASTNTRRDAQRFAETFSESLRGCTLHISGCEKGCARRSAASFTLVGRGGRYDIIKDGSADSMSVHETINSDDIQAAISLLIGEPAI
jgi:precorrin-3B synthase